MATKAHICAGIATGALGGFLGAFVMNQFQSLWSSASKLLAESQGTQQQQSSSQDEDATQNTAREISEHVFDHELTESEKGKAGTAVHYGIGTLMGAVYGISAEALPISRAGRGTIYGAAVWLFADEIAVPAFGLSGSPLKTPLSTHARALSSHLLYGFATDTVRRVLMGSEAGQAATNG